MTTIRNPHNVGDVYRAVEPIARQMLDASRDAGDAAGRDVHAIAACLAFLMGALDAARDGDIEPLINLACDIQASIGRIMARVGTSAGTHDHLVYLLESVHAWLSVLEGPDDDIHVPSHADMLSSIRAHLDAHERFCSRPPLPPGWTTNGPRLCAQCWTYAGDVDAPRVFASEHGVHLRSDLSDQIDGAELPGLPIVLMHAIAAHRIFRRERQARALGLSSR